LYPDRLATDRTARANPAPFDTTSAPDAGQGHVTPGTPPPIALTDCYQESREAR